MTQTQLVFIVLAASAAFPGCEAGFFDRMFNKHKSYDYYKASQPKNQWSFKIGGLRSGLYIGHHISFDKHKEKSKDKENYNDGGYYEDYGAPYHDEPAIDVVFDDSEGHIPVEGHSTSYEDPNEEIYSSDKDHLLNSYEPFIGSDSVNKYKVHKEGVQGSYSSDSIPQQSHREIISKPLPQSLIKAYADQGFVTAQNLPSDLSQYGTPKPSSLRPIVQYRTQVIDVPVYRYVPRYVPVDVQLHSGHGAVYGAHSPLRPEHMQLSRYADYARVVDGRTWLQSPRPPGPRPSWQQHQLNLAKFREPEVHVMEPVIIQNRVAADRRQDTVIPDHSIPTTTNPPPSLDAPVLHISSSQPSL